MFKREAKKLQKEQLNSKVKTNRHRNGEKITKNDDKSNNSPHNPILILHTKRCTDSIASHYYQSGDKC